MPDKARADGLNAKTKMNKNIKPRNQAELARALGCTRQNISQHCKGNNTPAISDVDGWRTYLEAFGRIGTHSHGDLAKEKLLKIRAERMLAENKLAEQDRTLVESARLIDVARKCSAKVKAMLDGKFRSELPARQGGLPADQIAQMNSDALDEIYQELGKE
jgi:predicted transcriptional regulator